MNSIFNVGKRSTHRIQEMATFPINIRVKDISNGTEDNIACNRT